MVDEGKEETSRVEGVHAYVPFQASRNFSDRCIRLQLDANKTGRLTEPPDHPPVRSM